METLEVMLKALNEKGAYYIDPENKIVLSREHLGETLAGNHEASILALEDKSLVDTLRVVDNEAFLFVTDLTSKNMDSSLVIFYLQYFLNNKLPFAYKEYVFKDIKTIGQLLFDDKISSEIMNDIIGHKLISYYLHVLGIDEVNKHLYEAVKLAEDNDDFDDLVRYHLIAYALCQKDNYEYGSHKFYSIEDFYSYLLGHRKMLRFSKTFDKDYNFMAWLLYNGKYDICKNWLDKVDEYSVHDDIIIKKGKEIKRSKK